MRKACLGGDRFQKELEKIPYPDEQDINLVQKVIVTQTDQIAESIQSIKKIEAECISYEKYLANIVTADASKNPTTYSKYGKNNIDIKQLASNTFLEQVKSDKDISKSICIAIEKYKHVNGIHNTVRNQNIDLDERLNQAGNLFQSSKHFLEKRRDTKGIIFLKAVGTVLSLGIAAPFLWKKTKGSEITAKMGSFFPKKTKNGPKTTEVETTNTKTHKK